jgi:hypothetical protein
VDDQGGKPLGQVLWGHEGYVSSVAFSGLGDKVVSGSRDKSVRLWQVDDHGGKPLGQVLRGHEGVVLSVAFSGLGDKVVSGSSDKTLRVWDISDVEAMVCLQVVAWGAVIRSVAFRQPLLDGHSPVLDAREADKQTGESLVVGDDSGCVSFWALGQAEKASLDCVGMPPQPGQAKLWRPVWQAVKLKGAKMQGMTSELLGQYRNQKAEALEVVIEDMTPVSSDSLSVRADAAEVVTESNATQEGRVQLEGTRAPFHSI